MLQAGGSNLLPTMEDCCAACWALEAGDGAEACNTWNFCNSPLGCARRGGANRTWPLARALLALHTRAFRAHARCGPAR